MNKDFLRLLMEKTDFPAEARAELIRCADALTGQGQEEALDGAVEFFYENDLSIKLTAPLIEETAKNSGVHVYTVWLLFLIEAAVTAREAYLERGVPEDIFWATFADLKYKVLECRNIHGVWGNFVSFWYPIFYSCDIVKLGRLEFENCVYEEDRPYEKNGYTVKKGDKVKGVHIPSSGEPFDEAARLDAYRRAYEFYQDELDGGPLVCVCYSWLLYPEYRKILSPTSNIVSFAGDFEILGQIDEKEFGDAWRVFGADYQNPLGELPEKTSMQRAFKQHLLSGGKTGEGIGILIFDGEKIVNR